ncbi:phage portal protein [Lysinibacillus odysseyi]|uniref:Portal protein n=1 Tax=Lysinibacillus odysseyi 34hs-1 = NBRC 100172 TaxID=1220589 RepID=A0A0A3J1G6_9BACI|nr:phage portal protein [Lysinibacillus odysseyi]KGR89038.1 portal protein [Lysinibacillus odysseyi 34hs-1 = NBRC 100172]
MGFLDAVFKRNSEIEFLFDFDIFKETSNRIQMKKLAINTCVSFLARTIAQSEFRLKKNGKYQKDELYYRLNVRPNKNQTASTFWQTVVDKLIHENECLIIQSDDEDLLIADSFTHTEYAVFEDTFTQVVVKDYEFKRTFKQSEVMHLRYTNENLTPLIDSLYKDYGDLFGRILGSQKRKNQIRSTVNVDANTSKNKESMSRLQEFINKMYGAIGEKEVAIVPQQPGFEYKEHYSGSGNGIQSVDEINKVTDGFLDKVAMAIGIPTGLLYGEMADISGEMQNYLTFTIKPFLKKIKDEVNAKFIEKEDYLNGTHLDVKVVSYQSIFDIADSVDKLISSGAFTGNEIREEAGWEPSEDDNLNKHYITKNYTEMNSSGGGENE